jgi:arylsulfatase A-like enzyme
LGNKIKDGLLFLISPKLLIFFVVKCMPAALFGYVYAVCLIVYSARVLTTFFRFRIYMAGFLAAALFLVTTYLVKRLTSRSWPAYPAVIILLIVLLPLFSLPFDYPGPMLLKPFESATDKELRSDLDPRLSGRRLKLDYEVREGVILPLNHVMMRPVDIPPRSRMRFAVGIEAHADKAPISLAVFVRGISGLAPKKVYGRIFDRDKSRWEEVEVDLSGYEGSDRSLALQVTSTAPDPDPGMVYISKTVIDNKQQVETISALPPNIALIVIDALRKDHLTTYGYKIRDTDPLLHSLWKNRGVRFDRAFAASSWTVPTVHSIFTSLYPSEHGIREVNFIATSGGLTTLTEILHDSGYVTAGFSLNRVIAASQNFFQGFDEFHDLGNYHFHCDGDQEAARRIADWIHARSDHRPFFLYVHLMNPHAPSCPEHFLKSDSPRLNHSLTVVNRLAVKYFNAFNKLIFPDPPWNDKTLYNNALLRAYDTDIRRSDNAFRTITEAIDKSGFKKNTMIIVVADHGEEFNDHGGFGHNRTLYQEIITIPMIIAGPMIRNPGRVISCPVSQVDIMPTILDYVDVSGPKDISGRSLRPVINEGVCYERPIYSEVDNRERVISSYLLEAVVMNGLKLIRKTEAGAISRQLYDLSRDPQERTDISSSRPEVIDDLEPFLEALSEKRDETIKGQEDAPITDEHIRALEALGYLE